MKIKIEKKKIYLKQIKKTKRFKFLFERMENLNKKPESLLHKEIDFKKTCFLFETLNKLASENITDAYFLKILKNFYLFFLMDDFKGTKLSKGKLKFAFRMLLENKDTEIVKNILTMQKKDGTFWSEEDILNVLEICEFNSNYLENNIYIELLSMRKDGKYWSSEELSMLNKLKNEFIDICSLIDHTNEIYLNVNDFKTFSFNTKVRNMISDKIKEKRNDNKNK